MGRIISLEERRQTLVEQVNEINKLITERDAKTTEEGANPPK